MGIRETLNQNRGITIGAVSGVIVLTLVYIVYSLRGESGGGASAGTAKAFFSDDDGQSYFADGADKIPPFDHNGKPAVTAHVFRCNGGKPFVGYLERYTPEGKKRRESLLKTPSADPATEAMLAANTIEVKLAKSGNTGWVKKTDARARDIENVHCPDGSQNIEPVFPD